MAKRPVTIYMHQNLENSHYGLNRPHFLVINKQQQQQQPKRRVNLTKKAFLRNFHVSLPPKETKSQTGDIQSTPVFLLLTLQRTSLKQYAIIYSHVEADIYWVFIGIKESLVSIGQATYREIKKQSEKS